MLFYTGSSRLSVGLRQEADRAISTPMQPHMRRMREMVDEAVEMLHAGRRGRFRRASARELEAEAAPGRRHQHDRRSTASTTMHGAPARSAASCSARAARASWCSWFPPTGGAAGSRGAVASHHVVPVSVDFTGSTHRPSQGRTARLAEQPVIPSEIFASAQARREGVAEMEVFPTKLESVLSDQAADGLRGLPRPLRRDLQPRAYFTAGIPIDFVQDDISVSYRHVLRGIHGDGKTWKLISCLQGSFYFVVVEQRPGFAAIPRVGVASRCPTRTSCRCSCRRSSATAIWCMSERAIFHYKQSTRIRPGRPVHAVVERSDAEIWWPIQIPSCRSATREMPSLNEAAP